jgi:hypothetical protein
MQVSDLICGTIFEVETGNEWKWELFEIITPRVSIWHWTLFPSNILISRVFSPIVHPGVNNPKQVYQVLAWSI